MQWYYAKGGAQMGPVAVEELKGKISAGEVGPTDLVWREGMGDWTPAGQVAELRALPEVPSAPSVTAATPSAMPGTVMPASPYQTPAATGYGGGFLPTEKIPNYLWQSIVVTLFCCWPLGIPAIVFAAKVDGMVARGDIAGARDASNKSKMWCWWSFGSGLFVIVAYVAFVAIMAASGNLH
jgi:hypothetical protein